MAESKVQERGRPETPRGGKKSRGRSSRAKLLYLDECAIWTAINNRDKTQDSRKSQKNIKLDKLRHTHDCFLQENVPSINAAQLITLLERFESQDERSHCAFMATFLLKPELEARTVDLWLEGGIEPIIAQLCCDTMLAFDMRDEVIVHRDTAQEIDGVATGHYQEARRMMNLDRKQQDGQLVFQHLSNSMLGRDPIAEQARIAHEKLSAAIELCSRLDQFCVDLETILSSHLGTCPDEGKDVIRSAAAYIADNLRVNMPNCESTVSEVDTILQHSTKVFNEAAHFSSTYVPPLTDSEKQKKMLERKAQADQAYRERMKKTKDIQNSAEKK